MADGDELTDFVAKMVNHQEAGYYLTLLNF